MREIHLTQGRVAVVDDEDFEELSRFSWWYAKNGYAATTGSRKNGKKNTYMHIKLLGKKEGKITDHINGDRLDNRKENLRHVTVTQNLQNSLHRNGGASSKYKGVFWRKEMQKWRSRITIDKKMYELGYYKEERDAAWVYNVWAESFFGEYARLNVLEAQNVK